ncbi:MAG: OmpH family outer membrane protein [Dongiaceae bacterium]
MRTLIIALAVAIATAAGGIAVPLHSAAAQSAQNVPLVVGTLDLQTILKQSKAGQSLEQALVAKSKAINADIGKTEQGLRAKRQQLEQQRSSLPPADYQAKLGELEKEFDALRKNATAKRKELELARNKGLEQISKTLDTVIRDIAQKRGLTLVINKSLVVLAADNWDITTEVQKGLDAKLPKVSI